MQDIDNQVAIGCFHILDLLDLHMLECEPVAMSTLSESAVLYCDKCHLLVIIPSIYLMEMPVVQD